MTEVGAAVQGVDQVGRVCPDLVDNLHGGASIVWVGDIGDDTTHWEDSGRIPP